MRLLDAQTLYGVTHLDHLDVEASIPTVERLAFQGDVAIIRTTTPAATTPIPPTGAVVVRGENGGNTHALYGPGAYDPAPDGGLRLGVLTVPEGAQVLLSHPEHGGFLFGPGSYELRRQREWADEVRIVAD